MARKKPKAINAAKLFELQRLKKKLVDVKKSSKKMDIDSKVKKAASDLKEKPSVVYSPCPYCKSKLRSDRYERHIAVQHDSKVLPLLTSEEKNTKKRSHEDRKQTILLKQKEENKRLAKKLSKELKSYSLEGLDSFLKTPRFNELIKYYLDHATKYNCFSGIFNFINLFKTSTSYKALLIWCCETLNLHVSINNNQIRLRKKYKKTSLYINKDVERLNSYLANKSIHGTYYGIITEDNKLKKELFEKAFGKSSKEDYDDTMNHCVSGSYGSGKRR